MSETNFKEQYCARMKASAEYTALARKAAALERALQNIADQPCRHHLLYDSENCIAKYPDREKWCMPCRAQTALTEIARGV